ncbi:MAG: BatA domain-containing protein [Planctomycetes bacterium]|nr:BatA domain-containing protein [Planctomycetota bacterium]
MHFLHPLLAVGALLFLGPLIIHLLNRQRFQKVPWGAMRFLLAAHKRTRRRVRLQNLLLLLLRCLAVALLAFGLARLFVKDVGGALGGGVSSEHLVLVIDASYSMAHRESGAERSLWDGALEAAEKAAAEVIGAGGEVTAILADEHPRVAGRNNLRALQRYRGPGSGGCDLAGALRLAMQEVESVREVEKRSGSALVRRQRVLLLSDLQRANFAESAEAASAAVRAAAPTRSAVASAVRELVGAQVRVEALGLGPKEIASNVLIAELSVDQAVAVGDPLAVAVRVENRGPDPVSNVELSLWIDGLRQVAESGFALAADETATRTVWFNLPSAGQHALEVKLSCSRAGDIEVDNARGLVVEALEAPAVLLVNGRPASRGADYERDAAELLRQYLSFELEDGGLGRFRSEVLSWENFRERLRSPNELARYRAIALCDVPPEARLAGIENLGAFVARGGGLALFLGERLALGTPAADARAAADYEAMLRAPASVLGDAGEAAAELSLLPGKLSGIARAADPSFDYFRIGEVDFTYPAFRGMSAPSAQPLVRGPAIFAFAKLEPAADPLVRVGARYDDFEKWPFLVERRFGSGRVVCITTTASLAWTELWRQDRTAILLLHDLFDELVRPALPPSTLRVGQSIQWSTAYEPRELELIDPVQRSVELAAERSGASSGRFPIPPVMDEGEDARAETPGIWRLVAEPPVGTAGFGPGASESFYFAKNVDADEGRLEYETGDALAQRFPELALRAAGEATQSEAEATAEATRFLLWIVLIFLLAETLLNMVFSRSRTR